MNPKELSEFVDTYANVCMHRESATQIFLKFMKELVKRIIAQSNEIAELNDDENDCIEECPCFYYAFNIDKWHTEPSAYVFLNLIEKTIGVVLVGYNSDVKEIKLFTENWNEFLKSKYSQDASLKAYTWVSEEDDDAIENSGYFKEVTGVNGKAINPTKIEELSEYFYWGYSFPFAPTKMDEYYTTIPEAFEKLLNLFVLKKETANTNKQRKRK